MSTVKISELPEISNFSTNTGATLFVGVDLTTGTTGKANLITLGEGLYAFQPLKVGNNKILFSNTIGQFSGNSNTFLQINNQNFNSNGSTDYVASTSDSDNSSKYIDFGIDGSNYNDPINYPFFKPYDGYLYVYGPSNTSSSGNLIVGTASSNSTITFITGLSSYKNVVAKMTSTGLVLNTQSYITFGDGSTQYVASNPANFTSAAYAQANVTVGVDATQNTRLSVIEDTNATQNVRLDYSNTAITIIQGVDVSQNARITIIEATDATQNTNIAAANGKMHSAYNTANNALANTTGTFAGNLTVTGNVTITGTVAPTKGFIYTPNIYPSVQTAVTISFADDSVVRAQTSAGLVVTLSSFVVGKSVEAWITNTAGTGQTFTHGCSAINSTINSTTYSIPATSSIFVKYWCMDGTLANTFVAITK
jgi:hypothetical protein